MAVGRGSVGPGNTTRLGSDTCYGRIAGVPHPHTTRLSLSLCPARLRPCSLQQEEFINGSALRLECNCRGDLALRHRDCVSGARGGRGARGACWARCRRLSVRIRCSPCWRTCPALRAPAPSLPSPLLPSFVLQVMKWVQVKGSNVCELCKAEIRNIPAPPPRAADPGDLPVLDEAYFSGRCCDVLPACSV